MWLDLLGSGIPPQMIDWQPNTVLVSQWKAWKPKQRFRPVPSAPTIPDALPAPIEAWGVQPLWIGASYSPGIGGRPRLPPGKGHWRWWEASCWSDYSLVPQNKQKVMAVVDTGAECTLIHGNPLSFLPPLMLSTVTEGECSFDTTNGAFSPMRIWSFYLSNTREYIGHWSPTRLNSANSISEFCLQVRVINPGLKRNANWEQENLLPLWRMVTVKQHRLPQWAGCEEA